MIRQKQRYDESEAAFLARHGVGVGAVLYGEPIVDDQGRRIERARQFRVTAIGEQSVLARTAVITDDGVPDVWHRETNVTFSSREWTVVESGDSETHVWTPLDVDDEPEVMCEVCGVESAVGVDDEGTRLCRPCINELNRESGDSETQGSKQDPPTSRKEPR